MEVEELETMLTKLLRDFNEISGNPLSDKEIEFNVDKNVREIIRESGERGGGWYGFNPSSIVSLKKALFEPAGNSELLHDFQKLNDDLYTICTITKRLPQELKSWNFYGNELSVLAKALNTSDSGSGSDWIPTGFSNLMFEYVDYEAQVQNQFPKVEMLNNPYTFPLLTSDPVTYLSGEATSDSPSMYRTSTPGSDSVVFTAKKLTTNTAISEEMVEDAVISTVE